MGSAKILYRSTYVLLMLCSIGLALFVDRQLLKTLHFSPSIDQSWLLSSALFVIAFGITVPLIHFLLPKPKDWAWWMKLLYRFGAGFAVLALMHLAATVWFKPDYEQITVKERIQYEYLAAYIEALANGELKVKSAVDHANGLDIATGTSLVLAGLTLKDSDSTDLLIGKGLRFDSESITSADYAKFLDVNDVMKSRYQRYSDMSKKYFHADSASPETAVELWQSVELKLDQRWNNFTEKKSQLQKTIDDKTESFIPMFKFYLRLRGDCQQSESCLDQAEKHYLTRIVNGLSLPKEPRYWCDKADRSVGQVFLDLLSGFGFSDDFENRLMLLEEHYHCPNTTEHISDRMLTIYKASFNQSTKIDFQMVEKIDYISSQKGIDFAKSIAKKSGVKLPDDWTLAQKELFLEQAKQASKLAAKAKYDASIQSLVDGYMEPGLSFIDFSRVSLVAEKVAKELDFSINDTLSLGRKSEVVIPTVLSPYYVGLADELFAQASFSKNDKTGVKEAKIWLDNAVKKPNLMKALTLIAAINLIFLIVFVLNHFFSMTRATSFLIGAGLASIILVVPLFTRPAVTATPFYRYLVDDFYSWSTALTYAWFVHIQPIIFAFGTTVAVKT